MALCREDPHIAYEAYEFVCEAVTFTTTRLGRDKNESREPPQDRHVSGAELLQGVCDLAIREFGMMAPMVFKRWGIQKTDDIGQMVFNLIKVELLSKSDRDAPEDFHDLFDLQRTLTEGFQLSLDNGHSLKRGDR
jgi:uncharacterized repeat protein (TIGR04138 family)